MARGHIGKWSDGFGDLQGECGVCECGCVCSYVAVSLIELAMASVIVHGYPCQEHLAFYVNDLMTQQLTTVQLGTVHKIDDTVHRCDVCLMNQ